MSPSRPSSSSERRVTPSRPTICSAPCAWWKWVWENLTCFASSGFLAYACSAASDFSSAWSISPFTQVSGPMSKSAAVLMLPRAVGLVLAPSRPRLRDLEVRHRPLQFLRELRDLADRDRGLLRAFRGLLGDRENVLHRGRHVAGGPRLRLRGDRDLFDELREPARHLADLG